MSNFTGAIMVIVRFNKYKSISISKLKKYQRNFRLNWTYLHKFNEQPAWKMWNEVETLVPQSGWWHYCNFNAGGREDVVLVFRL